MIFFNSSLLPIYLKICHDLSDEILQGADLEYNYQMQMILFNSATSLWGKGEGAAKICLRIYDGSRR